MNTLLSITAVAAALATAFTLAPEREITTEVVIDADPGRVWSVLTDGAAYGSWNPFIVSMKGEVAQGAVLENTMEPQKGKQMTFRPRVLAADENKEFRWLGRFLLPRIFDGEHYFLLESHERGTRLVHGERFSGIGLWFIDPEQFRGNFEAMNAALKKQAESGRTPAEMVAAQGPRESTSA
ncbi:MAG: SRPBCC domain-containing protein [Rhizobiaceae bacterium]|nr:SRPBCC domain-containing protein [Rhizobiaceae bacterium]